MPAPQPGAVLSRANGSSAGIQIHPWRDLRSEGSTDLHCPSRTPQGSRSLSAPRGLL